MQPRLAALLMMLVLALSPSVYASGKKQTKAILSFHMETESTDNPKMIFQQLANGKVRTFRRMPEVTTKDVQGFTPFPSEGGGDNYGMVIQLRDNAAKRLASITNINQGRWMITQANGRIVDGVLIDKQIDDGRLVIWKGLTLADIDFFDKTIPRIGQVKPMKK
jgi:hypothetical protein